MSSLTQKTSGYWNKIEKIENQPAVDPEGKKIIRIDSAALLSPNWEMRKKIIFRLMESIIFNWSSVYKNRSQFSKELQLSWDTDYSSPISFELDIFLFFKFLILETDLRGMSTEKIIIFSAWVTKNRRNVYRSWKSCNMYKLWENHVLCFFEKGHNKSWKSNVFLEYHAVMSSFSFSV